MSKTTREHLSCLMDGELTADAAQFLTRRTGSDEELNGTWQRYHLIRDCLRRPGEVRSLARLRVDLDSPAAAQTPSTGVTERRWARPLAGFAIAASVATAAVLVAVNLGPGVTKPAAEPFVSPNVPGINRSSPPATVPVSYDERAVNRYLLRHNQATGAVGQKGFVALVPLVAPAPVQRIEEDATVSDAAASGESVSEQP
jgi:sigma-E factor negative regulatory protein RseA